MADDLDANGAHSTQPATPEQIDVYRQKYEVFRHLDKLRWQIPTLTLGSGALLGAFSINTCDALTGGKGFVIGLLCLLSAYAGSNINAGIASNHITLAQVANILNDPIPEPKPKSKGASRLLVVLLRLFGILSIAAGILMCFCPSKQHAETRLNS